jgi:uncharacterized protein (DUF2384 family)
MTFEVQFFALLHLVDRMVQQSAQCSEFDSSQWLVDWLDEPLPALGGRRPLHVLQERGGFDAVYAVLARMESGAYC